LYKKAAIIIAVSLLLGLTLPTHSAPQKHGVKVVVTLSILQTIVSPIVGDVGEVYSIVSGDVEPHSFTLTPSTIQEALNSDLIVITGHMDWEMELIERVSEEKGVQPSLISLNLLNLTGIKILEIEGVKNIHGFWLLPDNAIVIARALRDKLSTLKPEFSEKFSQNYLLFERDVLNLKTVLVELSEKYNCLGKMVVVGFYAEQYVAEALGLKVDVSLIGEGETIRPDSLTKIYNGLKSGDYVCIVVSDTALLMSGVQTALREVSEETGCSIAYVFTVSSNGLDRYDNLMYYNAGQVYSALLSNRKSPSNGLNVYLLTTILALLIIAFETILLIRGGLKARTTQ
jgi:zinc/manganese transport system substrate-binding protein